MKNKDLKVVIILLITIIMGVFFLGVIGKCIQDKSVNQDKQHKQESVYESNKKDKNQQELLNNKEKVQITDTKLIKEREIIGWLSKDDYIALKLVNTKLSENGQIERYIPVIYNEKSKNEKTFENIVIEDRFRLSPNGTKLVYNEKTFEKKNEKVKIVDLLTGNIVDINMNLNSFNMDATRWLDEGRLIINTGIKEYKVITIKGEILANIKLPENTSFKWAGFNDEKIYFVSRLYSSKSPVEQVYSIDLKNNCSINKIYEKENGSFTCYIREDIYILNDDFKEIILTRLDKNGAIKNEMNIVGKTAYDSEILVLDNPDKCILTVNNSLVEADLEKKVSRELITVPRILSPLVFNKYLNTVTCIKQDWSEPTKTSIILQPENLKVIPTIIEKDADLKEKADRALEALKKICGAKYISYSVAKAEYIEGELYFHFSCELQNSELGDSFYVTADKNKIFKVTYKGEKPELVEVK